jgi:hypothetical protein
MAMSWQHKAEQNLKLLIATHLFKMRRSSDILEKATSQNYIQEEIKSTLNSIHNLWSSHLLSKILKIEIYKTMILPVVLYGCET